MTQNARLALWVPTATPPDVKDIIATQGPPVGSVIPTAFEQPGSGGGGGTPSNAPPLMDGAVAPGTATAYSRGDHRHPTDTSKANTSHTHPESDVTNLITDLAAKAPLVSPSLTGTPLTPTAAPGTNNTQIASTAFVGAAVSAGGGGGGIGEAPTDGQLYSRKGSTAQWLPSPTGSGGGGLDQATADARYVNVAGDTMTGDLTLTTGSIYATSGTVDAMFVNAVAGQFETIFAAADPTDPLELATKQYVDAHAGSGGAAPSDLNPAMDNVAAPGTATVYARGDHVHPKDTAKANVVHAHAESDITGLVADLAAKADKTYVDAQNTAQDTAITGKVAKAGDTMTGALTLPQGLVSAPALTFNGGLTSGFHFVPNILYADILGVTRLSIHATGVRIPDGLVGGPGMSFISEASTGVFKKSAGVLGVSAGGTEVMSWSATAVTSLKPVVLPADPANPLEAATKQYVDNKPSGGGGSPGGATTQVQFNDAGVFAGDAGMVWDKTLKDLNIAGRLGWPAVSPDTWIQRNVAGSLEVWSSSGLNGDFKVRYITASSDLTLQGTNGKITWNNDAGLARGGVGMVAVISNTNGVYRDIKARTYVMTQEAVNALECASKGYVDSKAAPAAATAAEYIANSAPTKMLTPGAAWASVANLVAPAAVGSVFTLDMGVGIDFNVTLTAAGMTLANPTNAKIGQKGIIYLSQDATGGRTITTWGAAWKFPGGIKPTLTAGASTVDAISYVVIVPGSFIACTFAADFK